MMVKRTGLILLLAMSSAYAAPMPQAGMAGPISFQVECKDTRCTSATFKLKNGTNEFISDRLACAMTPCGPDAVIWHDGMRLISISLKGGDVFLLKVLPKGETGEGAMVSMGSGFFSVNDANNFVVATPSRSNRSFMTVYGVSHQGLLIEDKARTCAQAKGWLSTQKSMLDDEAIEIKLSKQPVTRDADKRHEKMYLDLAEYCKVPLPASAKKDPTGRWMIESSGKTVNKGNFWNPTPR